MPNGRHGQHRPPPGGNARQPHRRGRVGGQEFKTKTIEVPKRAVPGYLVGCESEMRSAPSGHRFLLYFTGCSEEWAIRYPKEDKQKVENAEKLGEWDALLRYREHSNDGWGILSRSKHQALGTTAGMGEPGVKLLEALAKRTETLRGPDDWRREAELIAPLATGLGNPHPVENGFAFLSPYGVPYLAGSGVKGVLRRAAEELALFDADSPWTPALVWALFGFDENSGCFKGEDKAHGWRQAYAAWVARVREQGDAVLDGWRVAISKPLPHDSRDLAPAEFLEKLANSQPLRRAIHWQGLLAFQDAFPDENARLEVDILNPHHRDYYKAITVAGQRASPHDAENPVPVFFLTVAPGARFAFTARPLTGRDTLWQAIGEGKVLLNSAFDHACDWLGFGAKTAVGYGAMEHKPEEATRQGNQQGIAPKPRFEVWEGARITWTKGNQTLSASVAGRKALRVGQDVKTLLDSLPENTQKRLDKGKEVIAPVEVEPLGNAWRLVAIVVGPAAEPK